MTPVAMPVGGTRLPRRHASCWHRVPPARTLQKVICRSNSTSDSSSSAPSQNTLARLSVAVLTEGLRVAGVGAKEYERTAAAAPPSRPLRSGDVAGVMKAIRGDYGREYFVTGVLTDAIYDDDCRFADPTVSFQGRELYKRNLQLLVPFLIEPAIQLKSLQRLPGAEPPAAAFWPWRSSSSNGSSGSASGKSGPAQLYAEWLLTCYVALPWRPYIQVNGSTTYTLNQDQNKIVDHVEAWDISAWQALLLLFRPSERAVWKRGANSS